MATPNDIDTLVNLRFDYFAAEQWEVSPAQREAIEASLRAYYTEQLNRNFFAALVEDGGEIVSTAFLAVFVRPANMAFPTGKIGTVMNVLTYPAHRRKGYAAAAVRALIDIAREQNLSYIELLSSAAGRPLYQKLGFVETARDEHLTEMKFMLV